MSLRAGLYDTVLTEALERLLGDLTPEQAELRPLAEDARDHLVDSLGRQLAALLDDLPDAPDGRALQQLALVNALLVWLRERVAAEGGAAGDRVDLFATPPQVLRAIGRAGMMQDRPSLGLRAPWLFTAGKGSPALLQEIRSELASCDGVDILVSFITVSGVRKLLDVLHRVTARGGQDETGTGALPSPRLRILTTTYTGATEAQALDQLARLPGCELRVSLDGRRTRLHAKAWIFRRATGFGSAYVGSANLSGAALTGGLEWTIKITQRGQDALFARAQAQFESLWADGEFQRYDPDDCAHRAALASALAREAGQHRDAAMPAGFFDLQPKAYQQEMLEALAAERAQGRSRNLVVAATGTGKTVVAAFDYRAACQRVGGRPRLLFVAHREEILRQALRCYREVLRDPEFGDLLTGAHAPARHDHLFATIDSVAGRALVAACGAAYWHSVVIDECHRLAGPRFDALVQAIRPQTLLGLTATPERSDGQPIARYFDARPDGSPAVELRLWHALELQLLAPFEYYACDDDTDFAAVPWDQPGERAAIDRLVTGNDIRARLVVREWTRLVADPRRSRALVFCVSVAHARFMAEWLTRAGFPAECVFGESPSEQRRGAPQRLLRGEICALTTVDLYNEGVDLPMVDTLLMLRPTQSPVLFQQQLGRGLRLAPGKENCLVLDFVGQHRVEFRFDRLLSGITGLSRRELLEAVEHGFAGLPPGCHIHLQKQTREQVLRGLRAASAQGWRRLTTELQTHAALVGHRHVRLGQFLHDQQLDLSDVYRDGAAQGRSGWTALKRDAGLLSEPPGPEEAYFSRRAGELLHADDLARLDLLAALPGLVEVGQGAVPDASRASGLQMLAYQIDGNTAQTGTPTAFLGRLKENPGVAEELAELGGCLAARASPACAPLPGLEDTPLMLHAAYGIREVLTAAGWLTPTRRSPFQAGVLPIQDRKIELLFVTLDKSEGYHDRIAYRDYAISPTVFHWQTQNSAGPDTRAGRRYLESASNGWRFQLFVRTRKGEAYRACGPVRLASASGDRPMSITWTLEVPLPARLFRAFSVLRDA